MKRRTQQEVVAQQRRKILLSQLTETTSPQSHIPQPDSNITIESPSDPNHSIAETSKSGTQEGARLIFSDAAARQHL